MAKVLIVDDEADARALLLLGLARHGHQAMAAADGVAACAVLDDSIDVVVTDLVMPRLDGIALLGRLAALCPQALRVVITSFADKERSVAALNLGAHYLIEKPFSARQLVEVIDRLVEQRGQVASLEQIFQLRLSSLRLSERERQLVVYVLKGLPNQMIGRQLGITEQTVKNYLSQLYRTLGVSSRSELFHLIFPI